MLASKIKVHPFFIKVYKTGCNNYSFQDCTRIISLLSEADLKSKGIHGSFHYDFLKDLVLYIDGAIILHVTLALANSLDTILE